MKSEILLHNEFSVGPTVLKLALLGGTLITGVCGLVEALGSAMKLLI